MQLRFCFRALAATLALAIGCSSAALSQNIQLLSRVDSNQVPVSAGGDSSTPIVSPDGRFVVFASTANNLVVSSNNLAIPGRVPGTFNVYLRDRLYGTNALVSVNTSGVAGGDGDSLPAGLSPDGRLVLFESSAGNLVLGDTNSVFDVFVRDVVSGTTALVSAGTDGMAGNDFSREPVMTPDGRYVAFVSAATSLVAGDVNGLLDVFVRDLQNSTTVLASVGATARPPSSNQLDGSKSVAITADGRYVAFCSSAANLAPGVPAGVDIYIRDLLASTTTWVSANVRTILLSSTIYCFNHGFSADGRFLLYEAAAANSVSGTIFRYPLDTGLATVVANNAAVPAPGREQIHSLDISEDGRFIAFVANTNSIDGTTTCVKLWDASTGNSILVSDDLNNTVALGTVCDSPSVHSDGRYVTFLSSAGNMVTAPPAGQFHIYQRDTQSGTTTLVDTDVNGAGSSLRWAARPSLSANGRVIVFESEDALLVAGDRNRGSDLFCRDLETGAVELISARHPALPGATPNGICTITPHSISADGRYVLFASEADNLVAGDTNGCSDIFLRDLADGSTRLVSRSANGVAANGPSSDPAISGDGRFATFTSSATNLVAGDANKYQDVFVCNLQQETIALVSVNTNGTGPGSGPSFAPIISRDGRRVLFRSKTLDLAPMSRGHENFYLRDLQAQVTFVLSTNGASAVTAPRMTPDGRFAIYGTYHISFGSYVFVWDAQLMAAIYGFSALVNSADITDDGSRIAFCSSAGLYVSDLAGGTTRFIRSGRHKDLRLSDNGRRLLAAVEASSVYHIYLYDLETTNRALIDHRYDLPATPGDWESDSPAFDPDGRFIIYRSLARDIVPDDSNDQPDIFLYDCQTGLNSLLFTGQNGNGSPNHRSLLPLFSADGDTLLFASGASDVASYDHNHNTDIFACAFLRALIFPGSTPGEGPWLSWPWVPDSGYRVEYKNILSDPNWEVLPGTITNLGVKAWLQDRSPGPNQRFYRIISF